jgi:hypothetical protein
MKPSAVDENSDFPLSRGRARIGVLLGLLFLAGPLSDLLDQSLGGAHLAALLLGLGLFVALYLSLLPPSAWLSRLGPEAALLVLASLPVIAIVLLAAGAPTSVAALFVYFVAAAGVRLPARAAVVVTLLTGLGVGIAGSLHGDSSSAVAATVLTIVSIGVLMTAFGRIARTPTRTARRSRSRTTAVRPRRPDAEAA